MSPTEIVIEGTIQPDGTLVLDEPPKLPAGRVTVVLRQVETANKPLSEDWWQFMQNSRQKMEEAGCRFMDANEVQAHVEWLREPDRIDDMLKEDERWVRIS